MAEIIDCTKCAFYNNGKCDNPNGMACNCANNTVCYFKELKRLEQENAELKAENEKLKNEIKKLEDFIKSDGEIDHINHEYTYKLKQTLQEIKEIAEQSNVDCIYRISVIRKILTKAEEE